ncbi:spore coat U domain-containing protein [Burkholderia sp. AU30198]|uniref:Csu type fimbrial protein n=1 Tax=Burkholderia sp. AU30198 TaxID=2879627 RepID=UPI001CF2D4BB|nr:spore coat U domain-containing protein [Burkholderia sp. AU30198]MCA8296192.1 spore coat U domain-containing protein [Burkholderia sp. AU30198]
MKRWIIALLTVVWLAAPWTGAHAETCSVTAPAPNFGSVSPVALAAVTTTSTMTVTCTWSTVSLVPNVTVCLNLGGTSPRYLTNGSNQMQYDLYLDSGYTQSWGSTYSGTTPISVSLSKPLTGTTANTTVTIYGKIAANQPTVPTVGDASTVYAQNFGGSQTSLNYGFYLLGAPTCASLATNGTFAFSATATVVNDCNITATNIAFAPVGVLASALTATGTINAQCTNGDAFEIALNGGASGNVTARTMLRSGGGGSVGYQLYLNSGMSTIWGDGTGGTTMATGTGSGVTQALTVYGQVPAQTTPAPGSYSDTITATISF